MAQFAANRDASRDASVDAAAADSSVPPLDGKTAARLRELEVRLRDAELERDHLRAALAEAERCKGDLIAALSHDLRDPLAPIRNSLYLLHRSVPEGGPVQRALAVIDRQVAHMSHLLEDLVDVTRSGHGQAAPEESAPMVHHARRVLVIEDNEDAAETLRDVLEMEGHTVEVASSGREGLDRARAFHPEAVLCDIGLPVMDGYEVARALRADPSIGGQVTLVALTGYARREDIVRAREAGFDAHLAKPPTMEQIAALLESLPRR